MDTLEKKHAFYSISDISEKLKVSQKTIRRHIASGKLKSSKIGTSYRIANDALEDFINNSLQDDKLIQYDILGKEIIIDEKAIHAKMQENKTKPVTTSKWQKKLEEMQNAQAAKTGKK